MDTGQFPFWHAAANHSCAQGGLVLVQTLHIGAPCKDYLCGKIDLLKEGGDGRWQDWSLINLYCTADLIGIWTADQVASGPLETLIWHVLNWVQNMGLVKPSQQTFQAITCIILIVREGTAWAPGEAGIVRSCEIALQALEWTSACDLHL